MPVEAQRNQKPRVMALTIIWLRLSGMAHHSADSYGTGPNQLTSLRFDDIYERC